MNHLTRTHTPNDSAVRSPTRSPLPSHLGGQQVQGAAVDAEQLDDVPVLLRVVQPVPRHPAGVVDGRLAQLVADVHQLLELRGAHRLRAGLLGDEVAQQTHHLVVAVLTGEVQRILAVLRRERVQSGHRVCGFALIMIICVGEDAYRVHCIKAKDISTALK